MSGTTDHVRSLPKGPARPASKGIKRTEKLGRVVHPKYDTGFNYEQARAKSEDPLRGYPFNPASCLGRSVPEAAPERSQESREGVAKAELQYAKLTPKRKGPARLNPEPAGPEVDSSLADSSEPDGPKASSSPVDDPEPADPKAFPSSVDDPPAGPNVPSPPVGNLEPAGREVSSSPIDSPEPAGPKVSLTC